MINNHILLRCHFASVLGVLQLKKSPGEWLRHLQGVFSFLSVFAKVNRIHLLTVFFLDIFSASQL